MNKMTDEHQSYGGQFSATDTLKKKIIDFVFAQCTKGCEQQKPISDNTYETGFIRGVKFATSMLWKYVPQELRNTITELYAKMDAKIDEIDKGNMSDANKRANKQKIADSTSIDILQILLVVLQHSPISTEFKEMEIFGDFKDIIKSIRQKEPVKLFSGELGNE